MPGVRFIIRLRRDRLGGAVSSKRKALVAVEDIVEEEKLCYYRMELLEGQTLREHIDAGPVPLAPFVDLAESMSRLSRSPTFRYHGDLKPENIIVTPSGLKILDPGYFGGIECETGYVDNCAITTTNYYPSLTADDLFAVAVILWEAALHVHPLYAPLTPEARERAHPGEELYNWVRRYESVGQYFLSPLLGLQRPTELRPDMPPQLETYSSEAWGSASEATGDSTGHRDIPTSAPLHRTCKDSRGQASTDFSAALLDTRSRRLPDNGPRTKD